ncbi:MAG: hypothetical protein B6U68_01895 [Candidatus Aenigmarchaeota archaeon ex4484_14]|nr:MAG: hypothetical protein B6U68_01895 [Candidatus Aenigmarchaeota archaeon ex4484_14]
MLRHIVYCFFTLAISILYALGRRNPFDLTPKEFEATCEKVLRKKGYRTEWTRGKYTGQHQVDIKAERGLLFGKLFKRKYFVECKNWSRPVGIKELRNFYAKLEDAGVRRGIFITSSTFTRNARQYARKKGIELINGRTFRWLCFRYNLIKPRWWFFLKALIITLAITYPIYWFLFVR